MAALMPVVSHREEPLPPPAVGARVSSPVTPLFPAGLVLDVRAAAGDELRQAALGWDVRYAQLEAGRFRGRCLAVHTANLQICIEDWSLGALKTGRGPRGAVSFLVPLGRGGAPRIQGRAVSDGEVVALFGGEVDYRSVGPARLASVSIERTALDGHVAALLGRHLGELRLQGGLSGLWTDGGVLAEHCHGIAARAAAQDRLLRDPVLARGLERKVVELLFARFGTPCAPRCPRRGRALARRAEAWLRQNLAEPPTIAALCAEVRASERTLHEAFREHLGTTPKAYLKTLRLNAARDALLRDATKTRVTDVALDWGFVHFGWFSQDYRRLFGETPRQTLQRGRAEAVRRGFDEPGRSRASEPAQVVSAYAM